MTHEADAPGLHLLFAEAHAQAAENAFPVFYPETDLVDAHISRHVLQRFGIRARTQ